MALIKSIAVLAVLLAAIAYFSIRARQLYRILRLGPTENRFDHIPERIRGVLSYVGLHTRMFRNVYSGTLHLFIFYGFVVLLTAIIQAFGEGIIPGFSLALIGGTTWIAFLQDTFGVLVLVGVLMALVNRLIIRPRQFHESNEIDALIILGLIATIMIGMLGQNAARVAQGGDPSAAWRPVSSLIARAFEGFGWQGTAAVPAHEVFYWMHILAVLAFLVYIPSSKHLHIIVAIPNVFFRKLLPKIGAQLPAIDLEHAEHYGVSAVTQWSWKNLLDLYSCTECGRCQEQCPAFLTGKPLNPKMIIVDARENLFKGFAEVDGAVHVLARDPNAARAALRAGGYRIEGEVEVLVLPMPDRPGELSMIMQRLADASVNLRFVYLATDTRVVIGADDITRARAAVSSSKT